MGQLIEVPGHGQVEFPDGMSDEQIGLAIRKNMMVPMDASWLDRRTEQARKFMPPADQRWGAAMEKLPYEAGAKVTDVTGSPALGYAANVGVSAIPALFGGKAAGEAAGPLLENAATSLMTSAVKPTLKAVQTGRAATAIQTMLDEGINATASGVMKLKGKIFQLNNEIKDAIANSTAIVNKSAAYGPLKETLDNFTKQVNPNADIAAIRSAWDEFINHPTITGDTIPVQTAQELKQGTYRVLAKKYGQIGSAETEAQKAIARGLKEQIAVAVPEVSGLNAQESKLLTALGVLERRVAVEGNKNPAGLSLLTHSPGAALGFMADRSGALKSILARLLYSGSEAIPQAAVGGGITGLEALQRRQ